MVLNETDFRSILKTELAQRMSQNPRYSIRAFARDLQLSAAQVTHVLNGRRGLSSFTATKIGKSLGWSLKEVEYFCSLVNSAHSRSRLTKISAQEHLKTFSSTEKRVELQNDVFRLVSEWHHFAILELLKIKSEIHNQKTLAKRLNINEIEVDLALRRLQKAGLIHRVGAGWKLEYASVISKDSKDKVSSDAVKKFHTQLMEKAKVALIQQSVDERYYRTILFPVRQKDLKRAQEKILHFHEEFLRTFSNGSEGDEVYSLGVQFFRVTEKKVK